LHYDIQWLNARDERRISAIQNGIQRALAFDQIIDNMICKGRIAQMATLPPYLDGSFKRVLNKALEVDFTKRYQTASEFLRDIHQLDRQFPCYWQKDDHLLVAHDSGKTYKLRKDRKDQYVVEKASGNSWRKDNNHDGTYESALLLARKS
jgi:eukaryotic-like serine/threonine-protein kinase